MYDEHQGIQKVRVRAQGMKACSATMYAHPSLRFSVFFTMLEIIVQAPAYITSSPPYKPLLKATGWLATIQHLGNCKISVWAPYPRPMPPDIHKKDPSCGMANNENQESSEGCMLICKIIHIWALEYLSKHCVLSWQSPHIMMVLKATC